MIKNFLLLLLLLILFIAGCSNESVTKNEIGANTPSLPNGVGLEKGDIPPNFKISTIENKPIELSSYTMEGKPVLVYFMATWCPYCKKDFTELNKIYSEYDNDVPIVVMSLDKGESAETINKYIKQFPNLDKVNFAVANTKVLSDYQVRFTTTKYAVSKEGKIIYKGSGEINVSQWRTLLDALKDS